MIYRRCTVTPRYDFIYITDALINFDGDIIVWLRMVFGIFL